MKEFFKKHFSLINVLILLSYIVWIYKTYSYYTDNDIENRLNATQAFYTVIFLCVFKALVDFSQSIKKIEFPFDFKPKNSEEKYLFIKRSEIQKELDYYFSLQNSYDNNRYGYNEEFVSKKVDELVIELELINIKLSDL